MTLRYPRAAAVADLVRAAGGLALTAGPLALLPLAWPVAVLLGAGTAVFAVFAVRAAGRARLVLTLDERGVRGSDGLALAWGDVESLRIGYYSTRRDTEGGWFELVARGAGQVLRVDSRLAGFDALVRAAAGAALRAGLELDATTRENLTALTEGTGGAARDG